MQEIHYSDDGPQRSRGMTNKLCDVGVVYFRGGPESASDNFRFHTYFMMITKQRVAYCKDKSTLEALAVLRGINP